jgi:uncharacterized membrane protein HdeD (DUF308 family)
MANEDRPAQLHDAARRLKSGVHDKLADIWWFLTLRGVFALALGAFALFWPNKNLGLLVLAVGIYCLADGAISLIGALRQPAFREHLVQAVILLAIGAILVAWPGATLRALLVLLGAAMLLLGISQVLAARRLPVDDPDRDPTIKIGMAAAIIGAILALWPGSGIAVISWVIGIAAILVGALLLFLGSRLRKLKDRLALSGAPG